MKQVVSLEEAVGFPLAHDITEIRAGEFKGPAFSKGHILKNEDLDHLRRLGKNHLYVLKPEADEMHEDEAAGVIAKALCGEGVGWDGPPKEGKITITASRDGLLKIDTDALLQFNMQGDVMCATRHTNSVVKKGMTIAGTRAIPLVVSRKNVDMALQAAHDSTDSILRVVPIAKSNVGIMITGNEVFNGLIEDKFEAVITKKVKELGGTILEVVFLPDDDETIAAAATRLLDNGADLLITTGGMSVDPDDRTRHALKKIGIHDIVYGTPVLPGAMFMVAYLGKTPILGIPACGMYSARTILDLIYPRVLTGEKITRKDIAELGHGGLCLDCKVCTYPICPFGK